MATFLSTFEASVRSVGTAVTLAAVGVYLHRRQFVSSEGKRTLAKISQQVTFPLFLFTKIIYCNQNWSSEPCPDVTKSLRDVWVLLFWPIVVVGIGFLVGYGAAVVSKCPRSQFRSVLAACGFGNSTGLPITLLTVVHANFPETSDLGHIDPTLFLSVYLLLYPVLQWGIGGYLLAPEEFDPENEKVEIDRQSDSQDKIASDQSENGGHSVTATTRRSYANNVLNNKERELWYSLRRSGMSSTDASLYISDADLVGMATKYATQNGEVSGTESSPSDSVLQYSTPLSPIADHDRKLLETELNENTVLLCNEPNVLLSRRDSSYSAAAAAAAAAATEYEDESFCETFHKVMARCFQPPAIGALAGICVAATPLRGYFVDLIDRESHAPLQFFFDGLCAVGVAAVPINMMILGCNLSASYNSQKNAAGTEIATEGARTPSNLLSRETMIAIVIGKMLVMPLIGVALALFLDRFVLDIPEEIDGAFYLVLMIVFITPTANNVMVMVELSGSDTKEGIAQVIALQYAVAPIMLSLTMSLVVGVADSWR